MSTPDLNLLRLPRDESGPVFCEPWEAQAFALAVNLSEQGYFSWKEWAAALADELKCAADRGDPDDGTGYYYHWLATLERLVIAKRLTDGASLQTRKEAWAEAYRHTPHGKPVELSARRSGKVITLTSALVESTQINSKVSSRASNPNARFHFEDEEALMGRIGFRDYAEHHPAFRQRFERVIRPNQVHSCTIARLWGHGL